jgi:HlyD family secretion protein
MLKWIIAALAILGAVFAILQSVRATTPPPVPALKNEPVRMPYARGIAGAGIVEPASQNVVIGVSDPGLVMNVYVVPGQKVKKGDPLFHIDTRSLEADLKTAQAQVDQFQAALDLVVAYRRKEEEPGLRAHVAEAEASVIQARHDTAVAEALVLEDEANLKDYQDRVVQFEYTVQRNATTKFDLDRARYQVMIAEAKLNSSRTNVESKKAAEKVASAKQAEAKADLDLFLAGQWAPNIAKAKADVEQVKAQVEKLKIEIDRHIVRAPNDAIVNSCYLKEGEYAMASRDQAESAAVVLGSLGPLHIRVDIDEFDAPRFRPNLPAVAYLKGTNKNPIDLEYVRTEPFVIPKRSLTNSQTELVDTRVLQAIYRIKSPETNVYVGQQMDVFIDTTSVEK